MATQSKSSFWGYFAEALGPLVLFTIGYALVTNLMPPHKGDEMGIADRLASEKAEVETVESQGASPVQEAEVTRREQFGLDCLSKEDHSFQPLIVSVRGLLGNPSSFEHIKTTIVAKDGSGLNAAHMIFRAQNDHAGYFIEAAIGYFRNQDCKLVSWYVR